MKIITAHEMSRIEKEAYSKGASEETFMWNAAHAVMNLSLQMIASYHLKPQIILFCGRGNNGGDAFAAGSLLLKGGFAVTAFTSAPESQSSPLNVKMRKLFQESGGKVFAFGNKEMELDPKELVVDGLLGTGFHGAKLDAPLKEMVECINQSYAKVLAIDIPSGINGDSGERGESVVKATETLFLGLPKIGAFFDKSWDFVGKIHVENFGLSEESIDSATANFFLLTQEDVSKLLPKIKRSRHKYESGYVVGIGGSPGLCGAPSMAAFASLRAGAGIVRLMHPESVTNELVNAPVEIVKQGFDSWDFKPIEEHCKKANAVFLGPGSSIAPNYQSELKRILKIVKKPCVVDAGGLTTVSENPSLIPDDAILTPHAGELSKLLKLTSRHTRQEMLLKAQEFVQEYPCIIVFKGSPTFIITPDEKPWVCPRGDPGMATAGTGDVLTGIITGLLAQGVKSIDAAKLGVYLHAVSGELAAEKLTSYSLVATDLIKYLPCAIKQLMSNGH